MRKIRIYFYKGQKTLFSKGIKYKQSKKYEELYAELTHTEIVSEKMMSYSSSEQDGSVRKRNIDFHPDRWCYIEIPVEDKTYDKIFGWCENKIGLPYDWLAIFFVHILNFDKESKSAFYCSEFCYYALWLFDVFKLDKASYFVTPADLAYGLVKAGYKLRYLK